MKTTLLAGVMSVCAAAASAAPLFENSVVSNDIDFIHDTDPSAFHCLTPVGVARMEMPDKRNDALFVEDVQIFNASFVDGTSVEIWAHPDLQDRAAKVAAQLTGPLGHLPSFMRAKLNHVVVHAGDETAFAEPDAGFFVVYDLNMARRIASHDLEETVFHEAIHVALDPTFGQSRLWRLAQRRDGAFLTAYGEANRQQEDLAETALFAMTYFQNPARLGDEVLAWMGQNIPERLDLLQSIFGPGKQLQSPARAMPAC